MQAGTISRQLPKSGSSLITVVWNCSAIELGHFQRQQVLRLSRRWRAFDRKATMVPSVHTAQNVDNLSEALIAQDA